MKNNNPIEYSLIIPVYNNEENLPHLFSAITEFSSKYKDNFETVFVVDGSPDHSYQLLLSKLDDLPFRSQLVLHSRNFGAFTAIRTGMEHAEGEYIAVMAADLQEPINLIETFFDHLCKDKSDIVFGKRIEREDPPVRKFLAKSYWKLYRKFVLPEIPEGGVDVFACNRTVSETILSIEEPNSSLIAQLFWVGYRRDFIPYERQERQHGESAWGLRKRLRYMLDSIFSYSDLPIMAVLWLGAFSCLITFSLGFVTLLGKLFGLIETPGYTTLILIILFLFSILLLTQGIIGCYLWRAFENTKKRPLNIIIKKITNNK